MSDDPQASQSTTPATAEGSTSSTSTSSGTSKRSSSSSSGSSSSSSSGPNAERRTPSAEEMEDQTPRTPGDMLVGAESRLNALRNAGPKRRQQLVWLQYDGRKGSTGAVRRARGEHIDLVVPDEENEAAADLYLDQSAPSGIISPAAKKLLAEQGISHETLQLSGTHYHFGSPDGGPTPVDPDHAEWLLNHPGLAFSKVDVPS